VQGYADSNRRKLTVFTRHATVTGTIIDGAILADTVKLVVPITPTKNHGDIRY